MENKLQELTRKLYDEGLEKGRAEADRLVAEAKERAARTIREAEAEAERILSEARVKADDTAKNTMTEIALAGKQAVAKIKSEIASLIVARSTASSVKSAALDPEFVKQLLLTVARNWNGADSSRGDLQALLPESEREAFAKTFDAAARELLAEGIEVGYSERVKSGFKVGARDGGYYISFSDEAFDELLREFLREKVYRLLYQA